MRNGYNVDILTSVDIQVLVKVGGQVFKINEGVIYGDIFKVSPFRNIEEKLFKLRLKHKDKKTMYCNC